VDASGIGRGNAVAALGAVVLLVGMFFLNWYGVGEPDIAELRIDADVYAQADVPEIPETDPPPEEDSFGAWEGQGLLGALANLLMVAAAASSLGIAFSAARGRPVPEASASASLVLALAAVAMVLLRIIFPVEEIDGFEFDASLELGIFVTLAGALIILAGRMLASQERGDTYI
jgi:hypothetical protein